MRRFIPFAIPSGATPTVKTQTKTATITTNGESVTVQPDSGFLLSSATVTANIPTEGGLPAPIAAMETGSFISSSEAADEVAHVFSPAIRPDLILVYTSENVSQSNTIIGANIATYNGTNGAIKIKHTSGVVGGLPGDVSSSGNNVTIKNSSSPRWRTSLTYYYIIIQLNALPTSAGDPPQSGTSEPGIML